MALPAKYGQTIGSIVFATSAYETKLVDISLTNMKREWLDATNMSISPPGGSANTTGSKIGVASAYVDPGDVKCEALFDASATPPIWGPLELVTISAGPGTTQATLSGQGQMIDFSIKMPLEGTVMRSTFTVKFSGPVTWTPGIA
jgi:hypothetical protein